MSDYLMFLLSISADGLVATSNLALKGITGIYAMGKINKVLESSGADPSKTSYYLVSFPVVLSHLKLIWTNKDTAKNYSQQWQTLSFSADHVMSTYGNNTSWGLLYNLFAPRLIGADIFPEQVSQFRCRLYGTIIYRSL